MICKVHTDGWKDGWMGRWADRGIDGQMDGSVDGRMDGATHGWTDRRIDGRVDRLNRRVDGWVHERTWMDGSMDGWKDGSIDRVHLLQCESLESSLTQAPNLYPTVEGAAECAACAGDLSS